MKKAWQGLGLLALALGLLVVTGRVSFARITTADNTDAWCVGISGSEVCVDSSGNFVPTTDNDTTLGTSSLTWAGIYTQDLTVSDDLTVTDNMSVAGLETLGKTQVGTGTGSLGVYSSSAIAVTSSYETVISSGVHILISATPSVSTNTVLLGTGICCDNTSGSEIPTGTVLVLTSTASAGSIILQDEGTLTGSRLQLGAATRAVGQFDTLKLIYDADDEFWREVSYVNN